MLVVCVRLCVWTCLFLITREYGEELTFDLKNQQFAAWKNVCVFNNERKGESLTLLKYSAHVCALTKY